MTMDVTVAICTHRRPRLLAGALESLTRIRAPDGLSWEVLVVENRCTEATGEVLAEFAERLPLRREAEPRPGLSHARNRAIAEARGEYIVWIDDDVRVGDGWLAAYTEAFRRWPDASFFGGPIRPRFEEPLPAWLQRAYRDIDDVRAAYGERDLGDTARVLRKDEDLPYGGNLALPLPVQRRHRFDPTLGRTGGNLLGGEELHMLKRVLNEGGRGRWVPAAGVRHFIPPERQSLAFLRAYFRAQGRTATPRPEDRPVPTLFGKPRWALRAAAAEEIKFRFSRRTTPPEDWVEHLIRASFAQGVLRGPPDGDDGGPAAGDRIDRRAVPAAGPKRPDA